MFWGGGSGVGDGGWGEEEEEEVWETGEDSKGELGGGGGGTGGKGLVTDPARPRCRRPLDRMSDVDGGDVSADIFRQLLLRGSQSKCMWAQSRTPGLSKLCELLISGENRMTKTITHRRRLNTGSCSSFLFFFFSDCACAAG